jgi:hypothetical protein
MRERDAEAGRSKRFSFAWTPATRGGCRFPIWRPRSDDDRQIRRAVRALEDRDLVKCTTTAVLLSGRPVDTEEVVHREARRSRPWRSPNLTDPIPIRDVLPIARSVKLTRTSILGTYTSSLSTDNEELRTPVDKAPTECSTGASSASTGISSGHRRWAAINAAGRGFLA